MKEWKVAHYSTADSVGGKALTWWCQQIEKRNPGQIKIHIFFSESLAKANEMLKTVSSGVADAAYVALARYSNELPYSNVCYIPFLPASRVDQQVMTMNELVNISPHIQKELKKSNTAYGYSYCSPYYELMGNKSVRNTNDFKDMRIKALPAAGKVFKKFGAISYLSPILNTRAELSAGTIDMINFTGPLGMYEWKFYECSKYYINGVQISGSRSMMLINLDSWSALSGGIRMSIESLRDEFAHVLHELYYDKRKNAEALNKFISSGIEIIEFPPDEREKMVAAAQGMQEQWIEETGGEVAEEVLRTYLKIKEKVIEKYK
jgi:TRAP-type C4-dicarboxylate transport system substrate-binding protein